jgi:hypothetical protein
VKVILFQCWDFLNQWNQNCPIGTNITFHQWSPQRQSKLHTAEVSFLSQCGMCELFIHLNYTVQRPIYTFSLIFQALALTRQGDPRVGWAYWNQGAEGGSWRVQQHAASICSNGASHLSPAKLLLSHQTPPVPAPASALSHPLQTCSSHAPHKEAHPPVCANIMTLNSCC